MRILVDLNRCQAYAQCCFLDPDDFRLHGGDESLLYNPQPDDARQNHVVRAAAACPVQAIRVELSADTPGKGTDSK